MYMYNANQIKTTNNVVAGILFKFSDAAEW